MLQRIRSTLARLFYRSLTKVLGDAEGKVETTTLQGPMKGLKLRLDLLHKREGRYFLGSYDRDVLEFLDRRIQPGWKVWDCGIYLGYYTCYFSQRVGKAGTVLAVDPDNANLTRARLHASLNACTNIEWLLAAIGWENQMIPFVISGNTNSHIPGVWIGSNQQGYQEKVEKNVEVTSVQSFTIDELVKQRGEPDLIKLDIEGAEGRAIKGAAEVAARRKARFLVELHNPECDLAVFEFMQRWGYQITSVESGRRVECAEDSGGTLYCEPV